MYTLDFLWQVLELGKRLAVLTVDRRFSFPVADVIKVLFGQGLQLRNERARPLSIASGSRLLGCLAKGLLSRKIDSASRGLSISRTINDAVQDVWDLNSWSLHGLASPSISRALWNWVCANEFARF